MDKSAVDTVRDLLDANGYATLATIMSPMIEEEINAHGIHFTEQSEIDEVSTTQAQRDAIGVDFRQNKENSGWPYTSFVSVFFDNYVPYLLVSDLSEHTKNIKINPQLSLLITDTNSAKTNKMQAARVSLMGNAKPVDKELYRETFLNLHPKAKAYFDFNDFSMYKVDVECARLVAGFGEAYWLSGTESRGE